MTDPKETAIGFVQGDSVVSVYTMQQKYIERIKRLKQQYPNDVTIVSQDEYGINVTVPAKWFKFVAPPRKCNLTEEQIAKRAENMKKAREKKK